MNCLPHVSSYYSAILSKTSRFIAKSSLYGCSTSSWKINFENANVKTNNLELMLTRFRVQSYSSRGRGAKSQSQKLESKPVMEEEKDAFFVVRKGDVVGVYKTFSDCQAQVGSSRSCVVEFDGASKGNPGPAGAAAVLRSDSGRVICRVREGLGLATNNVAEYQAMILGLKYALKKGYTSIRVQGDSKLVCMQVQGLWKARNKNMSILCKEAKKLKNEFLSVEINHVLRGLNSEADAQANLAVHLAVGEVQEVCE